MLDVIIIGAGQAALSIGFHLLKQTKRYFVKILSKKAKSAIIGLPS